jgi:hypothetical protein
LTFDGGYEQAQDTGRKSRQAVLDYLAEVLTNPANPATREQIREFKMVSIYFPDIKDSIDKVERLFAVHQGSPTL